MQEKDPLLELTEQLAHLEAPPDQAPDLLRDLRQHARELLSGYGRLRSEPSTKSFTADRRAAPRVR